MDKEEAVARIEELERDNTVNFNLREKVLFDIYELEREISKKNEKIDDFSEKIQKNKDEIVKLKNYLEILEM